MTVGHPHYSGQNSARFKGARFKLGLSGRTKKIVRSVYLKTVCLDIAFAMRKCINFIWHCIRLNLIEKLGLKMT